ncbi:SprT family zinc-dependent metalloprotease [Bifidobacterium miconisargentati]|uniref:YgjP family zinc-dependent metalloprotease n=1 Tax=Bifidobacterium miconisargentati TaxID=2834437 RepID=UPI001BDC83F5|nr:SprT family zinc-dependent metalloprotease [Bifidobacterium miconisargentati]MBW3090313.1 M48 family metallopeptidase [Bifidobacterium miconisargentati]
MNIDGLEVQVVRKPIKNMYLRIKPPNGEIVISAPRRMSDRTIVDFVRGRRSWIDMHVRKMAEARRRSLDMGGLAGGVLPRDGRDGHGSRPGVGGNRESNNGRPGGDGRANDAGATPPTFDRTAIWTDERKARAAAGINAQLPGLLAKWGPVIGRTPTHITLRVMTSRWGSCTPATGRIRLNLQLGLMEPRFLEYVLVHELTHLWERGHGAGFQRRMTAYLPNWRQLRRELNRRVVL